MADESIQKPDSENGEEQGEARNDVVVKIGLVGDAQVNSYHSELKQRNACLLSNLSYIATGWQNHIDGKVRRKQI